MRKSSPRSPAITETAALQFFFYGTLIAGNGNAAARATHARMRPIGPATVPGVLWAIRDRAGWYPALVTDPGGWVHGMLYVATDKFTPDDLARLDAWEDYRADHPADSWYLREEMPVTAADGTVMAAQAYRFNQPLPEGALAIPDGDFQAWLTSHGRTAYGA